MKIANSQQREKGKPPTQPPEKTHSFFCPKTTEFLYGFCPDSKLAF